MSKKNDLPKTYAAWREKLAFTDPDPDYAVEPDELYFILAGDNDLEVSLYWTTRHLEEATRVAYELVGNIVADKVVAITKTQLDYPVVIPTQGIFGEVVSRVSTTGHYVEPRSRGRRRD